MNRLYLRLFTAMWCAPCRTLKPILQRLKEKHNIEIEYVDIEENVELTQEYQIRSVPTLLFMCDDKVLDTINGLVPESQLLELLIKNEFV